MHRMSFLSPIFAAALASIPNACVLSVEGQGTFQNLDFESAEIVFANPFHTDVYASNALPGWKAIVGTNQVSVIQYGLLGAFYPIQLIGQTNGGSLDGAFSVLLNHGGTAAPLAGSLSQDALVPPEAQSLVFKAANTYFSDGAFTVSLGGQNLSCLPLAAAPKYTMYGADISSFAGRNATLLISAGINGGDGRFMIDDIQFSPQPIPEPSGLSLILLAGAALGWLHRHAGPPKAACQL